MNTPNIIPDPVGQDFAGHDYKRYLCINQEAEGFNMQAYCDASVRNVSWQDIGTSFRKISPARRPDYPQGESAEGREFRCYGWYREDMKFALLPIHKYAEVTVETIGTPSFPTDYRVMMGYTVAATGLQGWRGYDRHGREYSTKQVFEGGTWQCVQLFGLVGCIAGESKDTPEQAFAIAASYWESRP